MKNKSIKIVTCGLVAAMSLGLVACGSKEDKKPVRFTSREEVAESTATEQEQGEKENWSDGKWFQGDGYDKITAVIFEADISGEGSNLTWERDGISFGQKGSTVYIQMPADFQCKCRLEGMFKDMKSLKQITGLELFNIKGVANLSNMFAGTAIDSIDLSGMDLSEATDMSGMFAGCESLSSINLGTQATTKLTSLAHFFETTGMAADSVQVSGSLNTENVTDMSFMFAMSNVELGSVIDFLNTSKVESMDFMFMSSVAKCGSHLNSLDVSKVKSMQGMFCSNPAPFSISTDTWDVQSLENCSFMFANCASAPEIVIDWKNAKDNINAEGMFSGCTSVATIKLPAFDGLHFKSTATMFHDCEMAVVYSNGFTADASEGMFLYNVKMAPENEIGVAKDASVANPEGYFTELK